MTADEIIAMGLMVQQLAQELQAGLNAKQPRTTKGEWQALDCLVTAAANLRTAGIYLTVAQEVHVHDFQMSSSYDHVRVCVRCGASEKTR